MTGSGFFLNFTLCSLTLFFGCNFRIAVFQFSVFQVDF